MSSSPSTDFTTSLSILDSGIKPVYASLMTRVGFQVGRHRGFTLVELLVTLFIIALLTALALPAVNSGVTRAQTVKCATKMRNLYNAVILYQAEHDGFLPMNNAHSGGTSDMCWIINIRPYMGISKTDTTGPGTAQMATYLTCPAAKGVEIPTLWWESDYAASLAFGTNPARTDGNRTPKKAATTDTSVIAMFIDSANKTRSVYTTPPPTANLGYRHNNALNVIYLDGHIEKHSAADLPTSYSDPFWGF